MCLRSLRLIWRPSFRPRFRCRKMQILCSFQGRALPGLYHGTAGGLVAPPSTQMYCAMTDGHCMLSLQHDTRPRPRGKKYDSGGGGGGGINQAASPAASLSTSHCMLLSCYDPSFTSFSTSLTSMSGIHVLFLDFDLHQIVHCNFASIILNTHKTLGLAVFQFLSSCF